MNTYKKFKNFAFLEFIVGLIVGLIFSLLVTFYISNLPTDFMRSKSDNQSTNSAEISENFDPNSVVASIGTNGVEDSVTTTNQASVEPSRTEDDKIENQAADIIGGIVNERLPKPASINAAAAEQPNVDPIARIIQQQTTPTAAQITPPPTINNSYIVQAGAFTSQVQAQNLINKLQSTRVTLNITETQINGRTVYRVRSPAVPYSEATLISSTLDKAGTATSIIKIN